MTGKLDAGETRTARLVLRPFREEDVPAYAALRARPEVAAWLPWTDPTVEVMAERVIEHFMNEWDERGFGPWALVDPEGGRLIGHGGLRFMPEFNGVEVLWAIDPDFWGRGLVTEMAGAALDLGFGVVGLEEIFAIAQPTNTRSVAVMERIGLSFRRMTEYRGIEVAYRAITAEEWRRRNDG